MKSVVSEKDPLTFIGIGEVLYDLFEDKTETLGGAPFNFAFHAHQLASQLGIGEGIIFSHIGHLQAFRSMIYWHLVFFENL